MTTPAEDPAPASGPIAPSPAQPVEPPSSVHTTTFPDLLRRLNVSLAVSTYQAGKLVFLRPEGDHLNTHFRAFDRPMGVALQNGRLAVGCGAQVWEFFNVPAVCAKLQPPGENDACFLPRRSHLTGDIDVHEMAFAPDGTLWFVNTRFGCLCTLDPFSSFVPRWRPWFLSGLAPEDRCHLNGLCLADGTPRYATALGAADTAGGWRKTKATGGVLIDVQENRFVLQGLSMPHSPRLYRGRLWLQESGDGSLGWVDLAGRKYQPVCRLPGFTRGLDFAGPVAFVGISQVRESAVFSGIPLTERLTERTCGVYAVHTETGEVLAFLHFTAGVQEIFAVTVLPGMLRPELLNEMSDVVRHAYVLPEEAMPDVARPPAAG
jgi:uncharacterized protein (TIGR03032 family)